MQPQERSILRLIRAAEEVGLTAVAEIPPEGLPSSVDLRVMDGDQVDAAIRVHLEAGTWRYEVPARPAGHEVAALRTRHLGNLDTPVTADTLRALDYWFAKVTIARPAAPRPPVAREDVPGWMRPGYWEERGVHLRTTSVR